MSPSVPSICIEFGSPLPRSEPPPSYKISELSPRYISESASLSVFLYSECDLIFKITKNAITYKLVLPCTIESFKAFRRSSNRRDSRKIMHLFNTLISGVVLSLASIRAVDAFPFMSPPHGASRASKRLTQTTWSPSQLVDVTGAHSFQAPITGQR